MEALLISIAAQVPWDAVAAFVIGLALRQPKMVERAKAKILAKVKGDK